MYGRAHANSVHWDSVSGATLGTPGALERTIPSQQNAASCLGRRLKGCHQVDQQPLFCSPFTSPQLGAMEAELKSVLCYGSMRSACSVCRNAAMDKEQGPALRFTIGSVCSIVYLLNHVVTLTMLQLWPYMEGARLSEVQLQHCRLRLAKPSRLCHLWHLAGIHSVTAYSLQFVK